MLIEVMLDKGQVSPTLQRFAATLRAKCKMNERAKVTHP